MKQGQKALICVLGSFVLCTGANAISAGNPTPYQGIVDRNVFGLKPPPPAPDPEAQKPPPPNITLTGITTILGRKQALMKTPPPPGAKPGSEQAKEQSYILTIGQREGDIEVLDIDEVAGTVKVNNGGKELTLNFKDNGPKIAATPMPAPTPGIPGPAGIPTPGVPMAGAVPPPPGGGMMPAASSITTMGGGLRNIPTRTLRLPQGGNTGFPPGAAMGTPGVNIGGVQLGLGATPSSVTQQNQQQQSSMSYEESMAMMAVNKVLHKDAIQAGQMPPLPPVKEIDGAMPPSPSSGPPQIPR
jgi:hypothetical protein